MTNEGTLDSIREFSGSKDDEFLKALMFSVERLLLDDKNPARLNLIASCFREILTYQLDMFAPHDDVQKSSWYVQDPTAQKATRAQRIRYAVSAGLPDTTLIEIGVNDLYSPKELRDLYNEASKYTHVRPDRLGHSDEEAERFVVDGISSLEDFLIEIDEIRNQVGQHLQDAISEHTVQEFIRTVIDELDILSTHTRVEGLPMIDEWYVENIGHTQVQIKVIGEVEVELNYGSGGDRRRSEGATLYEEFPYTMIIQCSVEKIKSLETVSVEVDTSSWYE